MFPTLHSTTLIQMQQLSLALFLAALLAVASTTPVSAFPGATPDEGGVPVPDNPDPAPRVRAPAPVRVLPRPPQPASPTLVPSRTAVPVRAAPVLLLTDSAHGRSALAHSLSDRRRLVVGGMGVVQGHLGAQTVVVAGLRDDGVSAATSARLLLAHFHPGCVLLAGLAGCSHSGVRPGSLIVAVQAYGAGASRTPAGPEIASLALLAHARRLAGQPGQNGVVFRGAVASRPGAGPALLPQSVPASAGVVAADRTTQVLARVCKAARVPFLSVLGVSHRVDAHAEADFRQYSRIAADNAARFSLMMAAAQVPSRR